jgi:type II secretory pathway component PulF
MMPKFIEIFNGFNIELPLPTRMLINFSNFSRISGAGRVIVGDHPVQTLSRPARRARANWTSGG